jgi:hypothetical protein
LLTEKHHREAVEIGERIADGLLTGKRLESARNALGPADPLTDALIGTNVNAQGASSGAAHIVVRAAPVLEGGVFIMERRAQADLLRDITGNPHHPETLVAHWLYWHDGTVRKIAQTIYEERRLGDLPILADALEEAGCENARILAHCRESGTHVRGCWVIDLLLRKDRSR